MNTFNAENACFFTGHRVLSSNLRHDVYSQARKLCIKLITENNVTDFICGGALGFDTLAAKIILELKQDYPQIKLHLYFPCTDQSKLWHTNDKKTWENIKLLADSYSFVSDMPYIAGCMQLRNKKMADDAKYCIAYCTRSFGGTASTLNYAKEKNRVIFIVPSTQPED